MNTKVGTEAVGEGGATKFIFKADSELSRQKTLKVEGAAGTKARSADSWVGGDRKWS